MSRRTNFISYERIMKHTGHLYTVHRYLCKLISRRKLHISNRP